MTGIWQKEAELGHAHAQFMVGCACVAGSNGPEDLDTALDWLRKAAEQGHVRAQLALGDILLRRPGLPGRETEGAQWLKRAAKQLQAMAEKGDESAITELLKVYSGIYAQTKDLVQAFAWIHVAGALGDNDAAQMLAALESKLSREQIDEATALASNWLAKVQGAKKSGPGLGGQVG